MEKKWKIFKGEDCPYCGGELEVNSELPEEDDTSVSTYVMDCEDVRCSEGCGFLSATSIDDENGSAWIQDGNIDELENN